MITLHDWLIILVTSALAVPVTLVVTWFADPLRQRYFRWRASRSRTAAKRRLVKLEESLPMYQELFDSPDKLLVFLATATLQVISELILTLFSIGICIGVIAFFFSW